MAELYKFEHVGKRFSGPENLEIFKDINLSVEEGESLAIVGTSGSGKSTLLHLMGALDTPSSGKIFFDGRDMSEMKPDEKARFRNRTLGFVFQFHHLLPEFSALENVAMPALIGGACRADVLPDARTMLERVGLAHRVESKVSTLSGGERQRISIARAILKDAPIIILDEATANVDPENEQELMEAIDALTHEKTVIMIAHRLKTVRHAHQILVVDKGQIVQRGTHEALMAQNGIYRRFITGRQQAVSWKLNGEK